MSISMVVDSIATIMFTKPVRFLSSVVDNINLSRVAVVGPDKRCTRPLQKLSERRTEGRYQAGAAMARRDKDRKLKVGILE